jgi:polyisoprenyl-teichoic acid--peptidoglycan teichoic acid transferase
VAVPAALVVRSATAQQELIATVFPDDRRSATVEEPDDPANPFGDDRRVNVLLLGGDGGAGRQGVRTDTVMVASIETGTGATTLFSLPRNLQDVPFPAGSELAQRWPDGFDAGSESESLLNAIYRNGPRLAPDVLGPTDDLGADMLKLAVGEALGLPIDYYVLVNLQGFVRLVDALGGITVNVNYFVPIGGEPTLGIRPDGYLPPGPDQHLDGAQALDFARGRFGMSDYDRMDRQRCAVEAIVEAADPVTVLWEYRELASAAGDLVSTDIPRSVLDDFADLAALVDDVDIRSVVFDDTVITPAYPDYDRIRALVQEALHPPPPPTAAGPRDGVPPAAEAAGAQDGGSDATTDIEDACAYDPERAAEALEGGQPPTRSG